MLSSLGTRHPGTVVLHVLRTLVSFTLALALGAGVASASEQDCHWPDVTLVLHDGAEVQGELVGTTDGHFYVLLPCGRLEPVAFQRVATVERGAPPAPEPEPSAWTPPASQPIPAPDYDPPAVPEPAPERSFEAAASAPAPEHGSSPDPEPLRFGLEAEASVLAALGLRGRALVGRGLVRALSLRLGVAASPIAYQTDTTFERFHSLDGSWLGLYLLSSLELPAGSASLELSVGPAVFPMPPLHGGLAVGAAFRGEHGEHWGSRVGVLWFTDPCGYEPFLVLDIGPTWRW